MGEKEKKNPIMCLQTVDFYSHKENTAKLREEKPSFFDRREKKHTMCCVTIHFCGQNEHYCNFHTEVFSNIKSKNKSKFCLFIFPFSSITSTTFYYFSFSLLPLPKRIRQGLTAWILFVSLFSLFQKNKGLTTWILLCLPSPFSKNSKRHSLRILLILPFPLNKKFQRTNHLRYLLFPLYKVSKD